MIEFREIRHRGDDIDDLNRFYEAVYLSEFPNADERESLQNMQDYLRLKEEGWYGANSYHILLGFSDGKPLAGSITTYLAEPNSGVIEFMAIAKPLRHTGLGRDLLTKTEKLIAGDALRALGRGADCIVAEMNDPFKQNPVEDSLDPFIRASIWERWGYRKLDFPYVQPALSPDKDPVAGLLMLAKPCRADFEQRLPAETLKSILRGYMRWAMRMEEPETSAEYRRMGRHVDQAGAIALLSVAAYSGRDPARPLAIHEIIDFGDPDLDAALAVYARAFSGGPTDLDPDVFRQLLAAGPPSQSQCRYHLWAVRTSSESAVEGMASFFTFPGAGFGGYITLSGNLHGTGRFRLLLARIEEQMIRDALGARGWYIECDPRQESLFAHCGFYAVDCTYHQPPLSAAASYEFDESPPLRLMYKDFGRNYEPPAVSQREFLAAIEDIYRTVYRMQQVEGSQFYEDMRRQASRWAEDRVRFR